MLCAARVVGALVILQLIAVLQTLLTAAARALVSCTGLCLEALGAAPMMSKRRFVWNCSNGLGALASRLGRAPAAVALTGLRFLAMLSALRSINHS